MRRLAEARYELIDAIVAETDINITAALLEKDEHLTDALRALFSIQFDQAKLVFCGGTSLSKSHQLIAQMSEDADIKVVLKDEAERWNNSRLRRYLSDEIKTKTNNALAELELHEVNSNSKNNNKFIESHWKYDRRYEGIGALRPDLKFEFVTRKILLPCAKKNIDSIVNLTIKNSDSCFSVETIHIAETVGEKTISFLRRFAQYRAGGLQGEWDSALVRHIYDIHCIILKNPNIVSDAAKIFPVLVDGDIQDFGKNTPELAKNPRLFLGRSLETIAQDKQTKEEYANRLLPLVYGGQLHPFPDAWQSFESVAKTLLNQLCWMTQFRPCREPQRSEQFTAIFSVGAATVSRLP